jgi:NAD(P)-dependent dehydrogenase (short-subunit alcohol dehydrogenase family)
MRTWFITGCSTGFGRELAMAVLAHGDRAVVTARDPGQVADIVAPYGDKAIAVKLDVTDRAQIADAVKVAIEKFGGIDVLVNNAGIGYFGGVEESDEADVRRMFEINFWGLAHMTDAVLPLMREKKSGTIVNFSSVGGLNAFPGVGYYNATKFAVEGLSEALWQEVASFGIKVLVVEPSGFRTDWAGRSAGQVKNPIAAYEGTVLSEGMKSFRERNGKQAGDPKKAAEAVIAQVEAGGPNHHLPLGNMAFDVTIKKLDALRAEYTGLEQIARGADDAKN